MSLWQSFRSLSPRARFNLGVAVIAWGSIGLYISDQAERKMGLEPSERDKQALNAAIPKIRIVGRERD